jgi:hypothetical protein
VRPYNITNKDGITVAIFSATKSILPVRINNVLIHSILRRSPAGIF